MLHRTVKIGGSLLERRDLTEALERWFAAEPPARSAVIVGGGAVIEAMRSLDRCHGLDVAAMHWRCVRLLRATFEIAAELFPQWSRVEDSASLASLASPAGSPGIYLVDVATFYGQDAAALEAALPIGWMTTSDSIAALLARRLGSSELVLLKSCSVPEAASPAALAEAGVVDAALPAASRGIGRVRVEQLP